MRHVAFDGAFGHFQALGDVAIPQPFELTPEKCAAYCWRQAVEQLVQCLQGFEQQPALLGRRHTAFRQLRQRFQVSLLKTAAGVEVAEQAFAHGQQIRARLLHVGDLL